MRSKMFSVRKRRSRVAGRWGMHLLHANEFGGVLLRGKASFRTWHGVMVKAPWCFITFVFRRRELRI